MDWKGFFKALLFLYRQTASGTCVGRTANKHNWQFFAERMLEGPTSSSGCTLGGWMDFAQRCRFVHLLE